VKLRIEPLTADRWDDLVELFERPGASIARGCYCMYYRRSGKHDVPAGMTYSEANKRALKSLVDRGVVPGLIGYENGRPIGWVSLGPREDYAKLKRSPVMKPVDERPVWSIICFFVDAKARHRGVAEALLKGALTWARARERTVASASPRPSPRGMMATAVHSRPSTSSSRRMAAAGKFRGSRMATSMPSKPAALIVGSR